MAAVAARPRVSPLCLPFMLLLCCCSPACWARRLWSRVPAVASVPDAGSELWFQQRLDHFDSADARTWKQRYFENGTFYVPGGPVLLMVGGESPANPAWMAHGTWQEAARRQGALCLLLEHRYYGSSHPTANASVENLRYLSSEQALADLAHFRRALGASRPELASAKWVAVGGSYPGSLAAWFRLKYPHLCHAAIASSAPLRATVNFPEYLEVVRRSLDGIDAGCSATVGRATDTLVLLLAQKNYDKISKDFGLCRPLEVSSSMDSAYLLETLAGYFMDVVQYNEDNRAFEGAKGTNVTIGVLCGAAREGAAYDGYARAVRLASGALGEPCVAAAYAPFLADARQLAWDAPAVASGARQWIFQTCSEFGFYQTTDSPNQPFSGFPLSYKLQQCSDIFGPGFNAATVAAGVERTNEDYGALGLTSSRTVFPNGAVDPWHALGATEDLSPALPAVFVPGTAHCADMYPARKEDPPQLVAAREHIVNLLYKWLSED